MKTELDELLCERYPKIFADRHKPMNKTAMCWGFMCGDGWFDLIDALCAKLQALSDQEGSIQIVATQVKEKFGCLSFLCAVALKNNTRKFYGQWRCRFARARNAVSQAEPW